VPAAAEYASTVEHLDDASSRSARRFLESTAAVGPSPRPPISSATTKPGAEAADAEMGLRAVICERLSRITTLARVTEPARLKPILLLALVVWLQSADGGTVGALVVSLKESLRINDIQVGLLVTVSTVSALLPRWWPGRSPIARYGFACCGWRCWCARWQWR
jgi:hypothetical protein